MADFPPLPQGATLNVPTKNPVLDIFEADKDKDLPPLPAGAKLSGGLPALPQGAKLNSAPVAGTTALPALPAGAKLNTKSVDKETPLYNTATGRITRMLAGKDNFFERSAAAMGEGVKQMKEGVSELNPDTYTGETVPLASAGKILGGAGRVFSAPVEAGVKPIARALTSDEEKAQRVAEDIAGLAQVGMGARELRGPKKITAAAYAKAGVDREKAPVEAGFVTGQAPKTIEESSKLHSEDVAKAAGAPAKESVAASLRNIVSPTSAGGRAKNIEFNIRERAGEAGRSIAESEAKLIQYGDQAAKMSPAQQTQFYDYVEGRSKTPDKEISSEFKAFAGATREVMRGMRERLESMPDGEKMGFYQDYFPHEWKNPEGARRFVNDFVSKQGSAAATKARTYPTIADGLKAGLELAEPNPVKAASKYVTSTNKFIAQKAIVDQALKKGDAAYFNAGQQPEGWQPLAGRFSEKPALSFKSEGGENDFFTPARKLYAPPEVARIYNNTYAPGIEATALGTPFEALRKVTALNTATELALSAYHAATITAQSIFTDVARIAKNTAAGDWQGVGKATKAATAGQVPFIKGSNYKLGGKFLEQYKGLKDYGVDMEEIADHFAKGGGKVGQEALYRGSKEGGFYQAFRQGDLANAIKEIPSSPLKTIARVSEDISYPLFEHYIPRIKTAAFANLMGDWIRQNPGADAAATTAARARIIDMVDDRFGEMNMDNVFWSKTMKQIASVMLRAQGWDIGLVRQLGGGILDTGRIAKDLVTKRAFNKDLLDRPLFLAAAAVTTMMFNAAYQYAKTGKSPESMQDLILPRTGGTSDGKPERVMMPGHPREVMEMRPIPGEGTFSGIAQEAYNKLASFPKNVYEAATNRDYAGKPIGSDLTRIEHIAEGFRPFSLSDSNAKKKGTNLNAVERRVIGERPAGIRYTDPERVRAAIEARKRKEEFDRKRTEAKQKAKLEK